VVETGGPPVPGPEALAAGLGAEGAGDEGLAHAGRPADQDLLVLLDPAAGGELADEGLVELAAGRVVDRLDARVGELELRLLERAREALVLTGPPLGVDALVIKFEDTFVTAGDALKGKRCCSSGGSSPTAAGPRTERMGRRKGRGPQGP